MAILYTTGGAPTPPFPVKHINIHHYHYKPKEPPMNIYLHPINQAIIATDNTHCIYVPLPPSADIKAQLEDAMFMLADSSPRCFVFDQSLTDQALSKTPDAPLAGPDIEHGEPETP